MAVRNHFSWIRGYLLLALFAWVTSSYAQDNASVQMTQGPATDSARKSSDAPQYPDDAQGRNHSPRF